MAADKAHSTPEAAEFGRHLKRLRKRAGEPSFGVMSRTILLHTGLVVTDQTLANYHAGKTDPRKIRRDWLKAIARFYGSTASDLGPVAAAEIAALSDLASSDEVFSRSACYARHPSNLLTRERAPIEAQETSLPSRRRVA